MNFGDDFGRGAEGRIVEHGQVLIDRTARRLPAASP